MNKNIILFLVVLAAIVAGELLTYEIVCHRNKMKALEAQQGE